MNVSRFVLVIGTFLCVSNALAQVGGASIGVSPNIEIVCDNLTTQQRVTVTDPTVQQWDCVNLGLVVTPGDDVVISSKAYVADPGNVGGSAYGLTAIRKTKCSNRTTRRTKNINPPTSDWNCSATGLVLQIGDVVKQSVRGTVAAPVAVLPQAPANLMATAGDGSVSLTWDAAVGADFYRIYNTQDPNNPASTVLLAGESSTTMFTHSGLVNGVTYFYVVSAVNAVGESAVSNSVSVVPTALLFDHTGITSDCAACHNGVDATGTPATHLVTNGICETCHFTTVWTIVSYTHSSPNYPGDHNSTVICVNCHSSTTATADWRFSAYIPTCAGCHANNYRPGSHAGRPLSTMQDCSSAGCHRVSARIW